MRALALAVVAALCFALPIRAAERSPGQDWSRVVVVTDENGFMMGNANAKVKLIEYGSLACPHCRRFAQEGFDPLVQNYVRNGQVSYEFRLYLTSLYDFSVSMLARCAGPAQFFPMSQAVFSEQPQWAKRFENMTDADRDALNSMTTQSEQLIRLAEIADLPSLAARFGVTPDQAKRCLADTAPLHRLLNSTEAAVEAGIKSAPAFLINDEVTSASTWHDLEPQLQKAVRAAAE